MNSTLFAQNNAAHLISFSQYYRCGDIDVTGNQLTVEALVKLDGTGPYFTGQSANDIVSKHNGASDANYILRPDHCEITTTNGHFLTSTPLSTFSRDSFYHVAMTYNGSFLRFYVNGCLNREVPASGNLITNSYLTTIGQLASNPDALNIEQLYGFTDEVRIWNIVRTQDELRNNMRNLSSTTQPGLLAYYKFEGNSNNVQGNAAFNAIPFGGPVIQQQDGFDRIKLLNAEYNFSPPGCNANSGNITVLAYGGKAPYQYSLNGGAYQSSNAFYNLPPGTYTVSVKGDGTTGCTKDTTFIFPSGCPPVNSCDTWLKVQNQPSFFRIGDLDIPGNKVTIEATFNRTAPWTGSDLFQGDLVSKHEGPPDVNYLLRPSSAEITTTNGYFKTPTICPPELNKTYHAAMVYDGSSLKFYRNGFLMSQVAATGNMIQNNWLTQVGLYFNGVTQEQFVGYINEVRIWNIARTQAQIQTYMNQSLPSPQTTPGLLAYYTFDNLLNKQGNATWNGTLGGNATINQTNTSCTFIADSCNILQTNVIPAFTSPDTVCVNTPVNITNTSLGATKYFWNFCVADVNTTPEAVNIGNPGGFLSLPVFMDIVEDQGNYYAFVVNHFPGGITRLDFGNSMLNTPTPVFLGNPSNALNPGYGSEGIQIIKNNGKWYGIVVGGNPTSPGSVVRLVTISFGTNLNNPFPTATNWGNIGNMLQSIDLHVFQQGTSWFGFTVNAENNTITRFNFGNNLDIAPTAVNLGNIGGLNYPTGVYAVNDNGFWRVFVTNGNSSGSSLTRLDFGNSLLNVPVGVNLGNPGNKLVTARDITILKYCGQSVGFVVNASNEIIRLNFSSLTSVPTATNLGNLGNLNFSHSLSKLLRIGNDIYSFVTNVNNNTITRLRFPGCTSSNIPSSTLQNPGQVIYNTPGVYNINLSVDDGLPTQATYCRQVVVLGLPNKHPLQSLSFCAGDSLKIGTTHGLSGYIWNNASTQDSMFVKAPGLYWVEFNSHGCANRDSFNISENLKPDFSVPSDTALCRGSSITLPVQSGGTYSYLWSPSNGLSNTSTRNPIASPLSSTQYFVTATNAANCVARDTINVVVKDLPVVSLGNDTSFCVASTFTLNAGNPGGIYNWQDGSHLQTFTAADSGYYHVQVNVNGCTGTDTVHLSLNPLPAFTLKADTSICIGQSVALSVQTNGNYSYNWTPSSGLSSTTGINPVASPISTTSYFVTATSNKGCVKKDTTTITVNPKPIIQVTPSTTICENSTIQLVATGGISYQWSPSQSLSSVSINNPLANPTSTTKYYVTVTDQNSCSNIDSVTISVVAPAIIPKPADAEICKGDSVQLIGNANFQYQWSPSGSLSNPNVHNPLAFPAVTTDYAVVITEPVCNSNSTFTVKVSVNDLPDVKAHKSNDINCSTPSAFLSATGATTYSWSPSVGLTSTVIPNPISTADHTITYMVSGVDAKGCSNEDTLTVQVAFTGKLQTLLPSAFTPNNDGLNDCFGVGSWGPVSELEFSIYNRWGQIVFKTSDPRACWDGTFHGTPQPGGVFVYWVRANTACGKIFLKGTIALIR